jgi:hypothetical protein
MARDCPQCGLTNPTEAQRCDCGYDFMARQVRSSYLTDKQRLSKEAEAADSQFGRLSGLGFGPPFFVTAVVLVLAIVEALGTLAAQALEKLKRSR